MGLPKPQQAVLHGAGSERVRMATYSNGIRLREPIQTWEPYSRYGFAAELDSAPPHQPYWGLIDGPYLDVAYVEFVLEPVNSHSVRLQLSTTYQLSTPINGYAHLWIDFLLRDFQQYILGIVQARLDRSVAH